MLILLTDWCHKHGIKTMDAKNWYKRGKLPAKPITTATSVCRVAKSTYITRCLAAWNDDAVIKSWEHRKMWIALPWGVSMRLSDQGYFRLSSFQSAGTAFNKMLTLIV